MIEEVLGEENKVFGRFTWHTLIAANSSASPLRAGIVVDCVVTGKMVDSRILIDSLGMNGQLGVIPAEKAAT